MLKIVLAGAPMGKQRVRFSRATGRTFTPERTVNYEGRLALAAQEAMAGAPPIAGPVAVWVRAFIPIADSKPKKFKAAALAGDIHPTKKPDLDNIVKIAADALNLIVWNDDSQMVQLHTSKRYSDTPRLEIMVYEIDDRGGVFG